MIIALEWGSANKREVFMKNIFDQEINRQNTASEKWDGLDNRFGMKDALPMWIADMDFKVPEVVNKAIIQRAEHGIYGYTFRPESYFEAIVDWLKKRHHWSIEKEWIAHSPGVIPALALVVRAFTQPGDKIIIQSPVYHHFSNVIKAHDRVVLNNPLQSKDGHYTMDFADLEAKIDPTVKMLILCSPHNPVGRVWTRDELRKLGEICLKHNLLVVSDEIHFDIVYKNSVHTPFASISQAFADKSITCISPSKTFNLMGLQTSSLIIPNRELREMYNQEIDRLAIGSPNLFGMVALESAYRYGEEWLDGLINYLEENLDFMLAYIQQNIPQIKVVKPEGTYMVWLDCRELGLKKEDLDDFMLNKARIALNEGYIFGQEGEGFMRMNIACPRSTLEKAMHQLKQAINSLCRV
jgi:cysteine-S-conjugate beta-lyase